MNCIKCVSYSRKSWSQLKRLQSSVSTSDSKIKIPPRIERGPTDILQALESTVPRDTMKTDYRFQDDCFLIPYRRTDVRIYALSYESGKNAAMWIHKTHANLFPKNLSDPKIQAFQPPVTYTDQSQVTEDILTQAILEGDTSSALQFYEQLNKNTSNEVKQALLELLCFYNGQKDTSKDLAHSRWFSKPEKKNWLNDPVITDLYNFLIKQDSATATLAHNAMICGLAKWHSAGDACFLYHRCIKENIPLTDTTYHHIMEAIPEVEGNPVKKQEILFDIFRSMSANGVHPNIYTLNSALRVVSTIPLVDRAEKLMYHFLEEFDRFNIKPSLGSYFYAHLILVRRGDTAAQSFLNILEKISKQHFTIQHPSDFKFFSHAMVTASRVYCNKEIADKLQEILLTGNNAQFITTAVNGFNYYNAYVLLQLKANTFEQFFNIYQKIVPNAYIPDASVLEEILAVLSVNPSKTLKEYLPILWSDVTLFGYAHNPISFTFMHVMAKANALEESPTQIAFTEAACKTWNYIKGEVEKLAFDPIETTVIGDIVILLLRGGKVTVAETIFTYIIQHPNVFVPVVNTQHMNEVFDTCLANQCFTLALLVLEHAVNMGNHQVIDLAMKLHNIPELDDVHRNKLMALVGSETLLVTEKMEKD